MILDCLHGSRLITRGLKQINQRQEERLGDNCGAWSGAL